MIAGKLYEIGTEAAAGPRVKLFHSVVPPCRRPYQEHRHTAFELSMVCGGEGIYQAGEKKYPFHRGDLFLFSTNEPHCIVEIFDGPPLDILNLQFEPRFLWSPENLLLQPQYPDIFFSRSPRYVHCLSQKPGPAAVLVQKLLDIEEEFRRQQPDYKLMVKLHILSLLVLIRREYGDYFTSSPRPVSPCHLDQMERALDYVDRNLSRELTLKEIAREAAMSPAYFSSLFKKWNGVTLWEYIQFKRIESAVKQMASGGQSIAQIALECGYNSISNFNRSFRRVMGQSPGEYRKGMVVPFSFPESVEH